MESTELLNGKVSGLHYRNNSYGYSESEPYVCMLSSPLRLFISIKGILSFDQNPNNFNISAN